MTCRGRHVATFAIICAESCIGTPVFTNPTIETSAVFAQQNMDVIIKQELVLLVNFWLWTSGNSSLYFY